MFQPGWKATVAAGALMALLLQAPPGETRLPWLGHTSDQSASALPGTDMADATAQRSVMAVLEAVNRFRAKHNLPPVRLDERLSRAAQAHSDFMARSGQVAHFGEKGENPGQRLQRAGYPWRVIGENIAAGQSSAEEVVADWIGSPPHRANLLKAKVTDIGVGISGDYWTLDLAG